MGWNHQPVLFLVPRIPTKVDKLLKKWEVKAVKSMLGLKMTKKTPECWVGFWGFPGFKKKRKDCCNQDFSCDLFVEGILAMLQVFVKMWWLMTEAARLHHELHNSETSLHIRWQECQDWAICNQTCPCQFFEIGTWNLKWSLEVPLLGCYSSPGIFWKPVIPLQYNKSRILGKPIILQNMNLLHSG